MKKNQIIVLVSVVLSVAAAITATVLLLKHFSRKKTAIAPADLAFENDFTPDEENAPQESSDDEITGI